MLCGDSRSVVIVFTLHKNCLFWSVKIIRAGREKYTSVSDIEEEEFYVALYVGLDGAK